MYECQMSDATCGMTEGPAVAGYIHSGERPQGSSGTGHTEEYNTLLRWLAGNYENGYYIFCLVCPLFRVSWVHLDSHFLLVEWKLGGSYTITAFILIATRSFRIAVP